MADVCPYPSAASPLLASLTGFVDCQAQNLGQAGFNALVGGVILPAMLTGSLVIYVALIGYRLLLGAPYTVSDAILATVRAGLVILFCSHWTGYEAVFYRTATDGPAELLSTLLPSSGLPALSVTDGAARLDSAYDAIHEPSRQVQAPQLTTTPGVPAIASAAQLAVLKSATVTTAGTLFMAFSVGGALAARVIVGLLLALGPLLVVLALFDGTLGFFEGWVRALGGAALAATGATAVLALEVAFVEDRLASSTADLPAFTDSGLMITALVFGLISLGVMAAAARVGGAFRLRLRRMPGIGANAREIVGRAPARPLAQARAPKRPEISTSRARSVADAISRTGQREQASIAVSTGAGSVSPYGRIPVMREHEAAAGPSTGLGQSLRRGLGNRRTLSAGRRDGRA